MNVFLVHPGRNIPTGFALEKTREFSTTPGRQAGSEPWALTQKTALKSQCKSFVVFSCRFIGNPPMATVMVKCVLQDHGIIEIGKGL